MKDDVRPTADLGRLIDERPMSGLQIGVAVLCALGIFLGGYDIQVMALAVPALSAQWGRPPSDFGLTLSACVIGIALGSALLAHLGDRYGRRALVISALVLVGLATAATSLSATPGELVLWRVLTGLGVGVVVPNCNAWTAEYAPVRRRSLAVVMMNAAVAVGAFSAGFIAPPLIASLGWRGIFLVGGAGPLLVAAILYLTAPESLKFLLARRPSDPRIARILKRIAPDVDPESLRLPPEPANAPRRSPLELLSPTYRPQTLLVWGLVALNLFTLYVLISWLPTLLTGAGWSQAHALQGAVLIQAGGVMGGFGLSFLLDRSLTKPALVAAFLVTAAALGLFLVVPSGAGWGVLLLVIGAGVSGAQLSLNALAAAFYPPAIKATGVGWVGVIGGLGSIAAPMAGAWVIAQGAPAVQVLVMLMVPVLLCAGGMLLMRQSWQAY